MVATNSSWYDWAQIEFIANDNGQVIRVYYIVKAHIILFVDLQKCKSCPFIYEHISCLENDILIASWVAFHIIITSNKLINANDKCQTENKMQIKV